jgi:hypothetical protein
MVPCTQFSSLVASGSRITSIALSTLQSLCVIVAAQSSATTETIVLSPSAHALQFRARSSPVSFVCNSASGIRDCRIAWLEFC